MTDSTAHRLTELTVRELADRLASDSPVPGGGSAAALVASLGAALVQMVANLTAGRPEYAEHEETTRQIRLAAVRCQSELLELVELDAAAYEAVMQARRLPRQGDAEREARRLQISHASAEATRVPLRTAEAAVEVLVLAERMAAIGNRHAVSDAGVAAELAAAGARSALLNVQTNLPYLVADEPLRAEAATAVEALRTTAERQRAAVAAVVTGRMG